MEIRTHPTRRDRWVVMADWLGTYRIVCEGDIFDCIQFTIDVRTP